MLVGDDLLDPGGGRLDLASLVHDDVVVVLLAGQLDRCIRLAQLQLVGGLGRARAQSFEERFERRRDHEDEERLGHLLLHDLGALDVDHEDRVAAGRERIPHRLAGRAIPVAVDLVRLEEPARRAKLQEVQKYLVLTGHIITPRLIIANEAALQAIDPADRAILDEAIAEAITWQDSELARQEAELIGTLKTAGMTVIEPDMESFRKPVLEKVPPMFEEKWGKGTWDALAAL